MKTWNIILKPYKKNHCAVHDLQCNGASVLEDVLYMDAYNHILSHVSDDDQISETSDGSTRTYSGAQMRRAEEELPATWRIVMRRDKPGDALLYDLRYGEQIIDTGIDLNVARQFVAERAEDWESIAEFHPYDHRIRWTGATLRTHLAGFAAKEQI